MVDGGASSPEANENAIETRLASLLGSHHVRPAPLIATMSEAQGVSRSAEFNIRQVIFPPY